MAKVAGRNPDGSFYGLVDRAEDDQAAPQPLSGDPGASPNLPPSESEAAAGGVSDGLEEMTVRELHGLANERGLAEHSQLRKAELIQAIRASG